MNNTIRISELRKVKGNKVLVMFRQHVTGPRNNASSLVSLANKSDNRFSQSERAAILTGEASDLKEMFPGVSNEINSLVSQPEGAKIEVDHLVESFNGDTLNIQITENTIRDAKRPTQEPKRRGAEGPIMTYKGNPIYSHTEVVIGTPNHTFLQEDVEATSIGIMSNSYSEMGAEEA